MTIIPVHARATHVSARLGRMVAGVLVLAGVALAMATVLVHRAPEAAPFIKRPEYRKGWQDILKMTT